MLKLRTFSNNSPTSTVTLSQEYDEIQAANIFPSVQEDLSVSSSHAPTGMDNSHCSRGSRGSDHGTTSSSGNGNEVETLRAQVESLRQQLAERDSTVNELQRKIQEDKRAHDKLKERFELFLGGNHSLGTNNTSTRRINRDSEDTTSLSTADMQRINKHMDQLEAEKEASFQKVLKLSVMLAESKAKCCTLESQVDEYQTLITLQNQNLGGIVGKFMNQNAAHNNTATTATSTPNKKQPPQTPSTVATASTTTSDDSAPISDINLNASRDFGVVNLDSDDESEEERADANNPSPFDFEFDTSDSLAWSTRGTPLTYVSERATSTRFNKRGQLARSNTERGTMATTPRRNSAGSAPNNNHNNKYKTGFLGFRNILARNVEEEP